MDRALAQVRRGDPDPRVQKALARAARDAGAVRAALDAAFAARLAAAPETPAQLLAVETFLPELVAPLAKRNPVLLVVVDGMSGAVAGDVSDDLTDHRRGWNEVVRAADGAREAVLAALPTETFFSRASLFAAALRPGTAAGEKPAFASHGFWPSGGAVLVHKSGIGGSDGNDLGAELEQAVGPDGPPVVGVVLNAVDDSLKAGRQSLDPGWRSEDVSGLPQLLDRAASSGRIVVLTSDHGHILEHGSQLRTDTSGGARWRAAELPVRPDEVLVAGPRVLTPEGRAILAATEDLRYGREAPGYHGGASLAEVAIPLVVLLPPGTDPPAGWTLRAPGGPSWWSGDPTAAPAPVAQQSPPARPSGVRKKPAATQAEALFDVPAEVRAGAGPGRGARLVTSEAFRSVHAEVPVNRVPDPAVFAAVVDALDAAGGRLPVASVMAAAGSGGRNARGLVAALGRVLNRDSFPVITMVDADRAVALDRALLDEQFPPIMTGSVSPARRRSVLAALRRGTVPDSGLDLLAVGLDRLAPAFDAELAACRTGAAAFTAIRGEYGSGKTFVSRWLGERAKGLGMATAEVQISETDTPLHRLETVYRRLCEQLATATDAPSAFRPVLDSWLYALEEDVLAEGVVSPDDADALGQAVDTLLERRLAVLARTTPGFAAGLRGYRRALGDGDVDSAEGLAAWLAGQPHVAAAARRSAGVRGNIDHFLALGFLQGLLTVLRDAGHPGLVLVLDEVETLQRVRSDARAKALNALRQLLDELDGGRFPGLYLVITGTPAFFEGRQGIALLPPLQQRLHTDFSTDARFDNPRAPQVRLLGFDTDRLVELGGRVRDLYAAGADAPERVRTLVDDDYLATLAKAVAGGLGGKVGVAPRLFLRKLVGEVLDRVDQYPDFDPRRDYALTVSSGELTDVERQAAVGLDDIDIDV